MILTIAFCLSISNITVYISSVPGKKKFHNIVMLLLLAVIFQNIVIKMFQTAFFTGSGSLPVMIDSWKSFMGQICNPIACYLMSLRTLKLLQSYSYLHFVVRMGSLLVLLIGFGTSIFREYLTFTFDKDSDIVMGGIRPLVATYSNMFSCICQILFAIAFFYEIHRYMLVSDKKKMKLKNRIMISAIIQCILILASIIYYSIARPMGLKTASSLLPLIASLSCKFMLDLGRLFLKYHGDEFHDKVRYDQSTKKLSRSEKLEQQNGFDLITKKLSRSDVQ